MKIIAYYLPQFHQIPENDNWWGNGFTEWTNVKKGRKLFKNQNQPRVPLEGYYCLDNKNVMMRQAEMLRQYCIYGMAFYHYWFDGEKLLERPAENLLKWKDISMNFMFFWANHSWIRSWNGSSELLIKQNYGGLNDWKEHFDYMLPFFKDPRYIQIKGKPAIGIYNPSDIDDFDGMIECWNKLAINNGLNGIYTIETLMDERACSMSKLTNAVTLRAPNIATKKLLSTKLYSKIKRYPIAQKMMPMFYPYKYSYISAKKKLIQISRNYRTDKDLIFGDFVDWDNTCRHGRRGSVAKGQTIEAFDKYLNELMVIGNERNVDYLFMNAWNEWAEGMYLEPDTRNKYGYLETIRKAVRFIDCN